MSIALEDNPTQKLICVDEQGNETGRIVDRKTAHTSPGVKHLAIQVIVFNSKSEIVLHERPMTKVGGGTLDAPTTHVLAGETPADAALRCLKTEYGIPATLEVKILRGFAYDYQYMDGSCENEFCLAAYVIYDGPIEPDKEQVVRIVSLPAKEVVADLIARPQNFPVWFKETLRFVMINEEASAFFS